MVILCLGVDSDLKGCGAIQWASRKPNLLNVAATRAMYRLLIVGDAALWKDEENFKVAYEMLNQEV
ncbi:helicase [Ruminiclostridium cellobioparum]|nr:helicase [Ruminiclostridium cellobioparum]